MISAYSRNLFRLGTAGASRFPRGKLMTKRTCFVVSLVVCAVSMFCLLPVVQAQLITGSIVGTVTDATGSRVPDVTVTATEVATSTATTVTTDASGGYTITPLKIGQYKVAFQKTGFQRVVQDNVTLDIGQVVR